MMSQLWFLRMRRWAQEPPSRRRVQAVFVTLALCAALVAIEWLWGWPDWLTTERLPHRPAAMAR